MQIKKTISGDIPFLQTYEPYKEPIGTQGVYALGDMIVYDLIPGQDTTTVDYSIGTDKSYVTSMNVKNITTNVVIRLTFAFDKNIFILNGVDNNTFVRELGPGQTERVDITINNIMLDGSRAFQPELTQIKVTVENITINELTLRDLNVSGISPVSLPQTITLD